ncbi:hypothetical protein NDU88_001032 [Pleurodeles waltl]|uniref:Uncharacterized protein n=1 Tax=Pleurodeles waltl TaxID=8319 RepID=A0AAV7S6X2_PLEWA|nr:hypothetical protein NDU88_001032 [Pleurodeles waltl]
MVWGSSPPRDLRILSAEGRGCRGFTALSQPPFWVAVAAKLSGKVFRAIFAPRPLVVIMAGFKLWAWIVARGRRTTPHSLMLHFVLLLSLLVAKVSVPLAPFNGWCVGPHLHGTFVSSQPRAAVATGSLLCRCRHFGSRQPRRTRATLEQIHRRISSQRPRRRDVRTARGLNARERYGKLCSE